MSFSKVHSLQVLFLAFVLPVLAACLCACNSSGNSTSASPVVTPASVPRSYQDISSLPLNKALPLKYSRLQLVCEQTASYAVWPTQGDGDPTIITTIGGKEIVWDLLSDLKDQNSVTISNSYPTLNFGYEVDVTIKLFSGKVTTTDGKNLVIKNGVSLIGPTKGHLDYLNAAGKIMTAESTFTNDNSIFALEGNTSSVENSTFVLNKTGPNPGLSLDCTLEAELYPEFASDSQQEQ